MNHSTTNINLALVLTEAITDVSPILFDGETAGNESDTDFSGSTRKHAKRLSPAHMQMKFCRHMPVV